MVLRTSHSPRIGLRRLARPLLLLIVALLAAGICVLATVHLLAPTGTGT